jgi:hypothetical protein
VKFTPLELRELGELRDVDMILSRRGLRLRRRGTRRRRGQQAGLRHRQGAQPVAPARGRPGLPPPAPALLRQAARDRGDGDGRVGGIRWERTAPDGEGGVVGTGEIRELPVQAVYRAVGYFGSPLPGIPFDKRFGVIPNHEGRCSCATRRRRARQMYGVYATGWIKRGPVGLIGHTKSDAMETIKHVINDLGNWWRPESPSEESVIELLESRGIEWTDLDGWHRLDEHEQALGAAEGRARIKVVPRDEMVGHLARRGVEPRPCSRTMRAPIDRPPALAHVGECASLASSDQSSRSDTRTQLRLGPPCTPLNGSAMPRPRRSIERDSGSSNDQVVLVEERETAAVHQQAVGREVDVVSPRRASSSRVTASYVAVGFLAHGASSFRRGPSLSVGIARVDAFVHARRADAGGCRYAATSCRSRPWTTAVVAFLVGAALGWWPLAAWTQHSTTGERMAAAHRPHRPAPRSRGLTVAALALRFGHTWILPALLVFAASATVLTLVDLAEKRLPNAVIFPTLGRGGGAARAADLGCGLVDVAGLGRSLDPPRCSRSTSCSP